MRVLQIPNCQLPLRVLGSIFTNENIFFTPESLVIISRNMDLLVPVPRYATTYQILFRDRDTEYIAELQIMKNLERLYIWSVSQSVGWLVVMLTLILLWDSGYVQFSMEGTYLESI